VTKFGGSGIEISVTQVQHRPGSGRVREARSTFCSSCRNSPEASRPVGHRQQVAAVGIGRGEEKPCSAVCSRQAVHPNLDHVIGSIAEGFDG